MFNAPRRMGGGPLVSSAFLTSSTSSEPYADPLASSMPNPSGGSYGDVDPWSSAPSPVMSGTPRRDSVEGGDVPVPSPATAGSSGTGSREGLNGLISDPPPLYLSLLDQLDPTASGEVSLSAVHRLLSTSKLPAATIEKIVNLTSRDKPTLTRQEFFCALALVALAQSGSESDISIERLSASLPNIPSPNLSAPRSPEAFAAPVDFDVWEPTSPPNANGDDGSRDVAAGYSLNGVEEPEAERGYWKRLEIVEVSLISEKEGWFLQKYKVESDKRTGGSVSRRYSDFVWLLDCLVKRYPFRLLPSLPPKRIGPDASFLEQRRKGLRRFINMVVNHPVTRDDGALNVFLTEPAFEAWRKRTKVSTEEESASKKLNPAQEMGIPADLDEKLGILRDHLPAVFASYQKLVVLAERSLARLQAASADVSRIALSLHTVAEEMPRCCYRSIPGGQACPLCGGVGRGLGEVGESWTRVAEEGEKRVGGHKLSTLHHADRVDKATAILLGNIEALKTQRDLYLAFRDLFARHDRLSKDNVDALRKKVETRQKKLETTRSGQKPGWEVEAEKLVSANDVDNSTIGTLFSRRVFIRACMWHELAVVFHSRQAAQATLGWREFAREQGDAGKAVVGVWEGLAERLKSMPVE